MITNEQFEEMIDSAWIEWRITKGKSGMQFYTAIIRSHMKPLMDELAKKDAEIERLRTVMQHSRRDCEMARDSHLTAHQLENWIDSIHKRLHTVLEDKS
ncbi:hypothetical protein LCGC14_2419940 [marine sediment metagenome]|uniref:Uncharacterized protein n=1 Tax=marine sediment metagenome TaxID=412755 RepID=A0A0F9EJ90_9ZZZZ